MAGTECRQVVDHPRTDGYGHGIGLGKHGIQLPDIRPFGIEFRVGEDVWFILRDTRSGQYLMHVIAGHAPCIGIGHDKRPLIREKFSEHIRNLRKGIGSDHQRLGVGRARQGTFYFIHSTKLIYYHPEKGISHPKAK